MKNKKEILKENSLVNELIRKVGFKIKDAQRNNQPDLVNKLKEQLKQKLTSMKINWMQNPYAIEVLDESIKKNKVLSLKEGTVNLAIKKASNNIKSAEKKGDVSGANNMKNKLKSDLEKSGYNWKKDQYVVNLLNESKKMDRSKKIVDKKIFILTKKLEEATNKKVVLKENIANSNDLKLFADKTQELRNYFFGTLLDKHELDKQSSDLIKNCLDKIQNVVQKISINSKNNIKRNSLLPKEYDDNFKMSDLN